MASDVARYPSQCKIKICYKRWILTCMFSLFSRLMLNMFTDVFFTIAKRGPLRDEDCYWDYGKARCSWPEYCEYRFGCFLYQILFLIIILIYFYFLIYFFSICLMVSADIFLGMFTWDRAVGWRILQLMHSWITYRIEGTRFHIL